MLTLQTLGCLLLQEPAHLCLLRTQRLLPPSSPSLPRVPPMGSPLAEPSWRGESSSQASSSSNSQWPPWRKRLDLCCFPIAHLLVLQGHKGILQITRMIQTEEQRRSENRRENNNFKFVQRSSKNITMIKQHSQHKI